MAAFCGLWVVAGPSDPAASGQVIDKIAVRRSAHLAKVIQFTDLRLLPALVVFGELGAGEWSEKELALTEVE
jgi:hypothetical protein